MKIALVEKMRSGKDTIENILNKYFPEKVAEGKPRAMYQGIGQHFMGFESDVWINYADHSINAYLNENQDGDTFNHADLEDETEQQAEAMLCDYQINNDGIIDDLCEKIESVLYLISEGKSNNV